MRPERFSGSRSLLQCAAQNGEDSLVLFAGDFFLNANEHIEIQDADAEAAFQVHMRRVRQQLVIAAPLADGSEEVERAKSGHKKLMPRGGEMGGGRLEGWPAAVARFERVEGGQEPVEVCLGSRVNDVEVEGGYGRSVEYGADSSGDDEFDVVRGEFA